VIDGLLVAQNSVGKIVSLAGTWSKEKLVILKESDESFICPSCKQAVMLKVGNERIPHFAHLKKSECDSFSEGESSYHLKGKLQLYDWLMHQGYSPTLEPYFQHLKQRPDLFVDYGKHQYMLEYQCSTIEMTKFKSRTENYITHGYQPIWILGGKRLKRVNNHLFQLSSFEWMFIKLVDNKPSLLYYCSEMEKFLFLHNIFPLTPSTSYATLNVISPTNYSFNNSINLPGRISGLSEWLEMKKSWRLSCTIYPSQSQKNLLNDLYKKRLYPSLLPSEVGIPVPSMYWIQTHPMIWQAWILVDFIHKLPNNATFSFQDLYRYFNSKKRSEPFYIRDLPLVTKTHYSFALMEYMNCLSQLGILEYVDKKMFRKIKNGSFPIHIEEALEEDKKQLLKLNKINKGI
jgi:competence CoiA-like predicted nuclease